MELEAGRVPIEADEVDQEASIMFQVGDHVFVRQLEPGQGPDSFPVRHDPLIISQSPGDVVPIIVP